MEIVIAVVVIGLLGYWAYTNFNKEKPDGSHVLDTFVKPTEPVPPAPVPPAPAPAPAPAPRPRAPRLLRPRSGRWARRHATRPGCPRGSLSWPPPPPSPPPPCTRACWRAPGSRAGRARCGEHLHARQVIRGHQRTVARSDERGRCGERAHARQVISGN